MTLPTPPANRARKWRPSDHHSAISAAVSCCRATCKTAGGDEEEDEHATSHSDASASTARLAVSLATVRRCSSAVTSSTVKFNVSVCRMCAKTAFGVGGVFDVGGDGSMRWTMNSQSSLRRA